MTTTYTTNQILTCNATITGPCVTINVTFGTSQLHELSQFVPSDHGSTYFTRLL